MRLTLRQFLAIAVTAILIGVTALNMGMTQPSGGLSDQQALHLLNRLGYGPKPGDIQRVKAMGREAYIRQQLSPEKIAEPVELTRKLAGIASLKMSPQELMDTYGEAYRENVKKIQGMTPEQLKAQKQLLKKDFNQNARGVTGDAVNARLMRAVESDRQLQQVMTEFWFNHFNIFANKQLDRILTGSFEEQAIRPYALGNFRDLLGATARHPAMMIYLDNWQNTAPNSKFAKNAMARRGKEIGINENYARELMELHTLGVDGGYSQQDVEALARVLTGWGIDNDLIKKQIEEKNPRLARALKVLPVDAKYPNFTAARHDYTDKTILGQTIKGRGAQEVDEVLDILAMHPSTAKHVSYKLAQYFVADKPPQALVDKLSAEYLRTRGDIKSVLLVLFNSGEFNDVKYAHAKFKTPYQYIVSTLRATGQRDGDYGRYGQVLKWMGQPVYECLTPDGYKNTQEAWLSPDAMSKRLSFATGLAVGRLPATNNKNASLQPVNAKQIYDVYAGQFSVNTLDAYKKTPVAMQSAVLLGSPEMMKK